MGSYQNRFSLWVYIYTNSVRREVTESKREYTWEIINNINTIILSLSIYSICLYLWSSIILLRRSITDDTFYKTLSVRIARTESPAAAWCNVIEATTYFPLPPVRTTCLLRYCTLLGQGLKLSWPLADDYRPIRQTKTCQYIAWSCALPKVERSSKPIIGDSVELEATLLLHLYRRSS
jgi:hypothetical protein